MSTTSSTTSTSGRRRPQHPRYRIVRTLGSGGGGSVFLARDVLDNGRKVAIKVARRTGPLEHILREFRVLRELRHPGIPRAYDFGRMPSSGLSYLTLEHIKGPTLEREMTKLRNAWRSGDHVPLLELFLQITSALAYLHQKGLLHLDLTPSNIVISGSRAMLIDFGIFHNLSLPNRRALGGTARYAAPEVYEGGAVDVRSDLYSLGVTLYRTITGRFPSADRRRGAETADARLEPIAAIVSKLLAPAPRQRFQNAEDVSRALEGAMSDLGQPEVPLELPEPEFVGRKRELDQFFTWLQGVEDGGAPRLFLIRGEAGIGKTRFLESCATEALGSGVEVLPVRVLSARDYEGLRDLVEKLSALYPLDRSHKRAYAFLFTALGLASNSAALKELERLDLDQIHARVFAETLLFLDERTTETRIVVVEDLHRADAQFRDFVLRYSASSKSLSAGKVGLVATARDDPSVNVSEFGSATEIRLKPLRKTAVRQALRSISNLLDTGATEDVAAKSGGIPGLLAHLVRQELTGQRPGTVATEFTDPDTLSEGRLRRLDKSELDVAIVLRLFGTAVRRKELLELTGLSPQAFQRASRILDRLGMLGGSRSGYYLSDPSVTHTALRSLSPKRFRVAQRDVGRKLLASGIFFSEAATHLLDAGSTQQGLAAARQAFDELRSSGRVEEALGLASRALEAARSLTMRRFFREALADLKQKCGQFDEAEASYDGLLEDERIPVKTRVRVLRKRGGVYQRRGNTEASRQDFEAALALLERVDDFEEHLYVLNELASLYLFRSEFPRSTSFANHGLELLESTRAAQLSPGEHAFHALNFHSVSGHILLRQFEYERAIEEFQRELTFSEQIASLSNTALILNNLGIAYHQANRLKEALGVYRRASELAKKMAMTPPTSASSAISCRFAPDRDDCEKPTRFSMPSTACHTRIARRPRAFSSFTVADSSRS